MRSPGLNEEIKKEMKEEKVEIEGEKKTSSAATTPQEVSATFFSLLPTLCQDSSLVGV